MKCGDIGVIKITHRAKCSVVSQKNYYSYIKSLASSRTALLTSSQARYSNGGNRLCQTPTLKELEEDNALKEILDTHIWKIQEAKVYGAGFQVRVQ